MELVAASRMRGFQRKALGSRAYAWGLLRALQQNVGGLEQLAWGKKRTTLPVLFVIVTSDKGLCGSLNQQLLRTLWRSPRWKNLPPSERMLITIGRKSAEAALAAGVKPVKQFDGIRENLDPLTALKLVDKIVGYWERGECREIEIVSPHYVNPFVFHTTMKKFLPLSSEMVHSHLRWQDPEAASAHPQEELAPMSAPTAHTETALYEPSREEVVEGLARQLVQSLFIHAFYELKATEYSSRMVAMKNATEAADKMVQSLTLSYNKARQSAITQQLAELAGGSAAVE